MENKKFTVGEAINFGWETTKSNLLFLASLVAITSFLSWISGYITDKIGESPISVIVSIGFMLINMIISMGVLRIALNLADGKATEYSDLFSEIDKFWKYLFGSILYGLIVIGGLILLIIPGIIWAIKYQLYSYLIIDKNLGSVEALKESARLTDGIKWDLFILNLSFILIIILGFMALFVGIFVALPVTWVAMAYVYRKISKSASKPVEETA